MATTKNTSPSLTFFNFLKEGLLLPSDNRKLFAAVLAITVASTYLLISLGSYLTIQPQPDEIRTNTVTSARNSTDDPASSPKLLHFHQEIQADTWDLSITSVVYPLVSVTIGWVIKIIIHFAAVVTYSGEMHTFASLLGKAKAHLKGPILTLAFFYALEMIACIAFAIAMTMVATLAILTIKQDLASVSVYTVLVTIAFSFLIYYCSFLSSLSIVVAVAEPGCHSAGAVGRAWQMMRGKLLRAVVFTVVTVVLSAALWPVHTIAKKCALSNMEAGLLLGFLYTTLMAGVKVFEVCAMTAFYYECKGSTEASTTEYIKVSTKEQIDV
ncbi:unnamed protein product [Urochloa humidicola]